MRMPEGVVLYRALGDTSTRAGCPDVARAMAAFSRPLLQSLVLMVSADAAVPIRFSRECAYFPIQRSLIQPAFKSLSDLLDAAPDLSAWLLDWSDSATRTPDLRPSWATRRGIDAAHVRSIAVAVATEIASSRSQAIHIESTAGANGTLRIPARAQLTPQDSTVSRRIFHVQRIVEYMSAITPVGTVLQIPTEALQGCRDVGKLIEIHTARTRRTKAQIARAVMRHEERTDD